MSCGQPCALGPHRPRIHVRRSDSPRFAAELATELHAEKSKNAFISSPNLFFGVCGAEAKNLAVSKWKTVLTEGFCFDNSLDFCEAFRAADKK